MTFNFVEIDKTKIFEKFKRSDKGFKHFIGYNDNNIIRPLCIILPQMSVYTKYLYDSGKNMSFFDDIILVKCNENWNKIKKT